MIRGLREHMITNVDIAPLAMFRVLFGGLMFIATIRFAANGWINELYVEPPYFFSYYGFEWLPRPSELCAYIIFLLTA